MITDPAASRPGTHLDPDQMADLFEGLLDPAAADAARLHLASCRQCSADFALITGEADPGELGALRDLLPPAPIPQDVVNRIEAALHREPPLGTAPAGHAAAPRRRRFRLALGSLAGATLVVAGGIGVLTAVNSGSTSKSNSSAASGSAASPQRGDDKTAGQVPGGESPHVGAPPDTASTGPRDFTGLSIEQQARNLLGQHMTTPANGTAQTAKPSCSPAAVAPGMKPLATGQTQYQGKQALLLVYAEPGSTTVDDVYVVDLNSCTPDNPGQVLYQTTITRP